MCAYVLHFEVEFLNLHSGAEPGGGGEMTTDVSFLFCDYNVNLFGTWVFSRPFQWYITSPHIPKISTSETKENLQLFSDCRAGWSKEL
jgi:hypothetical protein